MKCLVVGGTGFLGGAMVDALYAAGHDVFTLSRGATQRVNASQVTTIAGDRFGDLSNLTDHAFDWVFDSCAYSPAAVARLLDAVGSQIQRYVLISSVSAYGTFEKLGLTEEDPVQTATEAQLDIARNMPATDRANAAAYGPAYGPLKRACEIEAESRLGDRATSLRAGLLVGAGDYTDRLTWWTRRIDEARGKRRVVPAPAPENRPLQLIDVRDAADFAVACAQRSLGGIWNLTGEPIAMSKVLNAIANVSGSEASFRWISPGKIIKEGVKPWTDLPLMAPDLPTFAHFLEVDTAKARHAGLACRPLDETLGPLLAWDRNRRDRPLEVGLTAEQEARLLR